MSMDKIRILLVEDDKDDYVITRDLLSEVEGSDYFLEWVTTYESAIEMIKSNNYDVYLFDYRLGERTGLELLRETAASGNKVPVILLTGQGDKEVDMEAMNAGASDYLVKGNIDSQILERSIRYAIEHRKAKDQILHMAYYDSLTDLPNRVSFKDMVNKAINIDDYAGTLSAIMFLDLDNFKRINDTFGHTAGDALLKEVAERLTSCLRKEDCVARNVKDEQSDAVARIGGDEFTILLTVDEIQDIAKVAQRILDTLSDPFDIESTDLFVTASIGIAIHPIDGEDVESLLKNADAAMYHAKSKDKNNYKFYKKTMNEAALRRLTIENNLRRAVEDNNFSLYYQPKMEISTGRIIGMEALIRWSHPEMGEITPTEFIPLAEETGLILQVGEWVLRTACLQSKAWQQAGIAPLRVSVNMSGKQLRHQNVIGTVAAIMDDTGIDPDSLELEITESVVMESVDYTLDILDELKKLGVRLAMDDFGTGYSSFSYLKRIPMDVIKIDRSFIQDITIDPHDRTIISAIIVMAHSLEMEVVAEGVETEKQLSFLCTKKCDEMQGFLLSRPMPPDEATEFLMKESRGEGLCKMLCRASAVNAEKIVEPIKK